MIESLLTSPATRMLEQAVSFTERRQQVIAANIANISVPGYVEKDVSVEGFQKALQDAIDKQQNSTTGTYNPESNDAVDFYSGSSVVNVKPAPTTRAMAFHDRGVRSMEMLMGDMADNAVAHNTVVQLLRNQYDLIGKAISMKA